MPATHIPITAILDEYAAIFCYICKIAKMNTPDRVYVGHSEYFLKFKSLYFNVAIKKNEVRVYYSDREAKYYEKLEKFNLLQESNIDNLTILIKKLVKRKI